MLELESFNVCCACACPYNEEKKNSDEEELFKYECFASPYNEEKKEKIMEMIKTQDFIEGYWEENNYTKMVKDIYQKEYDLLKRLKNKNIDDKTALTILIIYYLENYPDFLDEFLMIIKKAKLFIQERTNESYEILLKKLIYTKN